ncbi:inorganic diphosphatase [Nocardia sp. BSTN01]|uniref:inorganic diphosphatase n=1 Tax=Nocardia sp. BSTN01 TaxID=2783665 RepID=UPI00188FD216|nr:inorganic diphosphatase [Nocardia sp. BSTN01]MBF5002030.1 inorganic diphosphatase [Nocardia sp. BSTN01]
MTGPKKLAESRSLALARPFLGKTVALTFDRPYGSTHPTCGFRYTTNYGFVPGTLAPDGKELDAYFLGPTVPLSTATGTCIAIVHRLFDDDDKLVVIPSDSEVLDDDAIAAAVEFQEEVGCYVIVRP